MQALHCCCCCSLLSFSLHLKVPVPDRWPMYINSITFKVTCMRNRPLFLEGRQQTQASTKANWQAKKTACRQSSLTLTIEIGRGKKWKIKCKQSQTLTLVLYCISTTAAAASKVKVSRNNYSCNYDCRTSRLKAAYTKLVNVCVCVWRQAGKQRGDPFPV